MTRTLHVHRFGDLVATHAAQGLTIYLTPQEAMAYAKALRGCAKEIKQGIGFTESRFGIATVPVPDIALESARVVNYKQRNNR